MINIRPAVDASCRSEKLHCKHTAEARRFEKKNAKRRHRHTFKAILRNIKDDPEIWDDESFDLPGLTSWDLD